MVVQWVYQDQMVFLEVAILKTKKIIGVGETGLDFYYDNSDRNKQIESFKIHIRAALKANIPLIIH